MANQGRLKKDSCSYRGKRVTASLFTAARACLDAASPDDKVTATFAAAEAFARGGLAIDGDAPGPGPIAMPGRPPRPRLVHPRELPRRGFGTDEMKLIAGWIGDAADNFDASRERILEGVKTLCEKYPIY